MRERYYVVGSENESRIDRVKEQARRKARDVGNWLNRNKEMVVFFTPMAIAATKTVIKVVGKNVNLRKEKDVKDLYCYDRSLGHYWRLRRELSNTEWIEIDRRKRKGERLADILSELKVLK